MRVIAHLSGSGSFSELAALRLRKSGDVLLPLDSFEQVAAAAAKGEAHLGVLPIENALAGSVHAVYDLLDTYPLTIIGEDYLSIELALFAPRGARLDQLEQVRSHPKALEQCKSFLRSAAGLATANAPSVGAAAQEVAELGDPRFAAITSEQAGLEHGLDCLQPNVADHANNHTRFITVTRASKANKGSKHSLLLSLEHRPGALAELLQQIAKRGGNLTKLEARPIPGSPFEYRFYLDVILNPKSMEVLWPELRSFCIACKLLGSYEEATWRMS